MAEITETEKEVVKLLEGLSNGTGHDDNNANPGFLKHNNDESGQTSVDGIKDGDLPTERKESVTSEDFKKEIAVEIKKDLETVLESLATGGHDNAIQTLLFLIKSNLKLESHQIYDLEKVLQWIKDGDHRRSVKSRPVPNLWDDIYERDEDYEVLKLLLGQLPCSSVAEDTRVMTNLQSLTSTSHFARFHLGRGKSDINKLMNRSSIERSQSGAHILQCAMVSILLNVCVDVASKTNVGQNCPASVPFLIECLTSPSVKSKVIAAAVVERLSTVDSNRKMIGESGAIRPLIGLVEAGDRAGLLHATGAILELCRLVENRERAVSDGVVTAAMDWIGRRVFVDRMLCILEMLCTNERAIGELEEKNVLQCLFTILREDGRTVSEKGKEYCLLVIHAICHRSAGETRKIDEVENGRRILESLVNYGSAKAAEKTCDLLWKLDFLDLTNRMFSNVMVLDTNCV